MREVDYRFYRVRNGVPVEELYAKGAPSIRFQSAASVMRSLSGVFKHTDKANWFIDRIRAEMTLDGVTSPLGVFAVSSLSENYGSGEAADNIEAMDYGLIVKQVSTEGILHLSAGTGYIDQIKDMLRECGLNTIYSDADASTLQTDREDWEEGTSYLTIINTLLGEINFNPLWFDEEGAARLTAYQAPSARNIKNAFKSGDDSIIADSCTIVQDIYQPYNVFKVIVSNADLTQPMTAVSVNSDPRSPISTAQLKRRIMAPIVKLDNIASQEALQAHADKLRDDSQIASEAITFTTANVAGHGYLDTIALSHERLDGIYQETDWTMQLSYSGKMTHKAKRILYI